MKNSLTIAFSFVVLISAHGQNTTVTLGDAIQRALEKNPSVQAASLETSRQRELRQTAFELPKTEVSIMSGQYNSIQKSDNNLTISQGIPFPTVFARQNGLNKAMITSATLKENISKNELTFQVKQVFNQLLYLELRDQWLLQQDSLLRDLLHIASVQFKAGEGTLLAKTSAETQLFEIQNIRSRNQADIKIALNHLQLLCQSPTITDIVGTLENFASAMEIDSLSFRDNPSLAYTRQQIEVATWQRKVETARALPDLRVGYFSQTLIGTQNINGQDQYFDSNKRFQGFQVGLSLPLSLTSHAARIKAASIATEVQMKQNESFNLNLAQQYNQALQELSKNKNSLNYYRDSALATAKLLVIQSRLAFERGEFDHTALLLNLKQALAIREGYLTALQQYNQSAIIINYLTGKF
jgi:cobalt-zinc-cadmium resistance protein CzcA